MKARASLALNEKNNAEIVSVAEQIVAATTSNPIFAESPIADKAELVRTATVNMRNVMNAPPSATHSREIALSREQLEHHLNALAGLIEDKANDPALNQTTRENIILASGMKLRGHTPPAKRVFSAQCGPQPGTAHLSASSPAGSRANAHEWKMAADLDNLNDCIHLESTTKGKTEVTGLARLKEYAFFHRPVIAGQQTEWEGPIFLAVV